MLKVDWLRNAKYSREYVTDDILIVSRKKVWVPDGYRPITVSEDRINKLFSLTPISSINTYSNVSRTYAKTTITRYNVANGYVILNDEYKYFWKNKYLVTLQECNSKQYEGPVGIIDNNGLIGIVSPIIVSDNNIDNKSYWVNVDEQIGIK